MKNFTNIASVIWNKFLDLFRSNLLIKLISILLAVLLWFTICAYVDPQTDIAISNLKISYEYEGSDPQSAGIGMMTQINETVDIRVSGSRDAIALMDYQKITATLDLSNITTEGVKKIPIKIDLGNQGLTLEDQSIKTLKVEFDRIKKNPVDVEVDFNGKAEDGFLIKSKLSNDVIEVSGPASIVNKIHSAKVSIGSGEVLSASKSFNGSEYVFLDKNGKPVDKTFLTVPEGLETIDVTMEVLTVKELPLTVNVLNGEELLYKTVIQPNTIKVAGTPAALEAAVLAVELNLAGHSENFEETVPLVLSGDLVNIESVESVRVSVTFEKAKVKAVSVVN